MMAAVVNDQHFCLRWNNHQRTLISVFNTLLESSSLADCTLATDTGTIQAHKIVLSACSSYFSRILQEHDGEHPIIILRDVSYEELQAMMHYMYRGEVNISQETLPSFLKAAESLEVKGLFENQNKVDDSIINGFDANAEKSFNGYPALRVSTPPQINSHTKKNSDARKLPVPISSNYSIGGLNHQRSRSPMAHPIPNGKRLPKSLSPMEGFHLNNYKNLMSSYNSNNNPASNGASIINHHMSYNNEKFSQSYDSPSNNGGEVNGGGTVVNNVPIRHSSSKRRKLLPPIKSEGLVVTPIHPPTTPSVFLQQQQQHNFDHMNNVCDVPSPAQTVPAAADCRASVPSPSAPPKVESPNMDFLAATSATGNLLHPMQATVKRRKSSVTPEPSPVSHMMVPKHWPVAPLSPPQDLVMKGKKAEVKVESGNEGDMNEDEENCENDKDDMSSSMLQYEDSTNDDIEDKSNFPQDMSTNGGSFQEDMSVMRAMAAAAFAGGPGSNASSVQQKAWMNWEMNPKYVRLTETNPFSCKLCGKRYRWKSTLKRHESFECGGKEPVHQCNYCDYRAKQSGNLRVHIRKYHAATGDAAKVQNSSSSSATNSATRNSTTSGSSTTTRRTSRLSTAIAAAAAQASSLQLTPCAVETETASSTTTTDNGGHSNFLAAGATTNDEFSSTTSSSSSSYHERLRLAADSGSPQLQPLPLVVQPLPLVVVTNDSSSTN